MPKCETCDGEKKVILLPEVTSLKCAIEVDCLECHGTGELGNPDACERCNDSKKVILFGEESPVGFAMKVTCPDCLNLNK